MSDFDTIFRQLEAKLKDNRGRPSGVVSGPAWDRRRRLDSATKAETMPLDNPGERDRRSRQGASDADWSGRLRGLVLEDVKKLSEMDEHSASRYAFSPHTMIRLRHFAPALMSIEGLPPHVYDTLMDVASDFQDNPPSTTGGMTP